MLTNDFQKGELIYEGKAKKVFSVSGGSAQLDLTKAVWVEYKNDLTAFNAQKKGSFVGKGALNKKMTLMLYEHLEKKGQNTHLLGNLDDTSLLCRKLRIVPVEVVVRRLAAGSLSKRLGLAEGLQLKRPVVELYYKSDVLGDPLINEDVAMVLNWATAQELEVMKQKALEICKLVAEVFFRAGIELVDMKLEFGANEQGKVYLADEITPDTCRLWDLESKQKLDKDIFRLDLGDIALAYQEVSKRLEKSLL